MIFDYKREIETVSVSAYGKEYPVPTLTVSTYNKINEITNRISSNLKDIKESTQAMLDGIAFFIGEDEAKRIFPSVETADTDEVFAFWITLKKACDDNTAAVIKKYASNVTVRKSNG